MSVDCRTVHGENGFCHCAMMVEPTASPSQPLDASAMRLGVERLSVGHFVRQVFDVVAGLGQVHGEFTESGAVRSTSLVVNVVGANGAPLPGSRPDPTYVISVHLVDDDAGEQISTALIIETTVALSELSIGRSAEGVERDVWSERGWTPLEPGESEEPVLLLAREHGGHYFYRALLWGRGINAIDLYAPAGFEATFHRVPIVARSESMEVGQSPTLIVAVVDDMKSMLFPHGVRVYVTAPDSASFTEERGEEARFVQRSRQSVRTLVLQSPAAGTWRIETVAIVGVGFHVVFQTIPFTDVMPTMHRGLEGAYPAGHVPAHGRGTQGLACTICTIAFWAIVAAGIAVIAAAVLYATRGDGLRLLVNLFRSFGVTRTIAVRLMGLGAVLPVLQAFCYVAGACDAPAEVKRLVDFVRTGSQRYDQCCFLTAHNAFSYRTLVTPLYAQQDLSIEQQLERGVDAFMLDIWPYAPKGTTDIYLCHEDCTGASRFLVGNSGGWRSLADELLVIADALDRDRDRVITNLLRGEPRCDHRRG